MLDKKTIRRGLLAARRALPPGEATANSAAICARVETLPEFEAARAGAFVPIELSVSSVPGIRAGRGDRLEGILPATDE